VEARASKELGMKPPELSQLVFAGGETAMAPTMPAPAPAPSTTAPAPRPTSPNGAATP